jgi:hypothetical protein
MPIEQVGLSDNLMLKFVMGDNAANRRLTSHYSSGACEPLPQVC